MKSIWMSAALLLALATTGGVERKASKINNEANGLFTKQQYDAAAKRYGDAQTRAPESPEIAYNLGNALYRQGRAQDAVPLLLQGTQSPDPKLRQKSLYNLGNALHQTGKLQEAVGAYRQSLTLEPGDRDAKVNYEKALRELQQQQQQQQQGNGQKNEPQNQGQNQQNQQDQSGQGNSQQDSQQQGEQSPDGKNKEQQAEQQQGKEGEPKDEQQKDAQAAQEANQEPQQAGGDTLAAGELSHEEALRILEAMRQQESELQKAKARQQKIRARRVDKDW